MLSIKPEIEADVRTLRALWPSLSINSVEQLGEGWMSRALLVNHELVFRFAKNEDSRTDVQKEICLLPQLIGKVSVAIPNFEFVGVHPDTSLPVTGYQRLPGELLDEHDFRNLPAQTLQSISEQLTRFLNELQTFPIATATEAHVPVSDFRASIAEDRANLRAANVGLAPDVQTYVEDRFSEYLDEEAFFDYTPCLLHADLSPDHLLVDREQGRLTGIIDFGDCQIGDPDYEYMYLSAGIGEEFARGVMRLRGLDKIELRMRKVRCFGTFDHVHSILGGLHFGRPELIAEGIEHLTREARQR